MKFQNNKKYPIWRYYSILYKDGLFYLVAGDDYVLPNGFKMIRILYKHDIHYKKSEKHGEIVLVMIYQNGVAGFYDLEKAQWIIEKFEYSKFRLVYTKEESHYEKVEPVRNSFDSFSYLSPTVFNDTVEVKTIEHIYEIISKKPYRLINYSLERGVILELNEEPEFHEYGYIIDKHIVHEFSEYETDLDTLKLVTDDNMFPVYYNEKTDTYSVLVDEVNGGIVTLYSEVDDNILKCDIEGSRFNCGYQLVYNIETEELDIEQLRDDDYGWTDQQLRDAADIAYEGYSRLELGLD